MCWIEGAECGDEVRSKPFVLRIPVAYRHHSGSVTITVIRYGENGPYTHDFSSLSVPQIYQTLLQAQADADRTVREAGHQCDGGWSLWTQE